MEFSTYLYLLVGWIVLAVITFLALQKIIAPFGRHTSSQFGPTINNNIGWMIMEVPSLISISYFYWTGPLSPNWITGTMYGLWCLHYINRSFIYPFRQRNQNKQMPLLIAGSAIFFNIVNGFFNGYYLGHFADYPESWLTSAFFIIGIVLFAGGMAINLWADHRLIHLRKPGESGYKIPKGGLFNYVSCPNLMGEMVEWIGFAVLCWNPAALSFAIWTVANLLPRAMAHHRWYQQKFDDYPEERKAVVPFVL